MEEKHCIRITEKLEAQLGLNPPYGQMLLHVLTGLLELLSRASFIIVATKTISSTC